MVMVERIASVRVLACDLISQLLDLLAHLLSLVLVHSEENDIPLLRRARFVAKVVFEGLPVSNRVSFICSSALFIGSLEKV